MRDTEFFTGVPHIETTWDGIDAAVPLFYYDTLQVSAVLATPLDRIRAVLPTERLHPLRMTPRLGITIISAFEYRDTDIGPYNEVLVGFPVSLDKRAAIGLGLRRFMSEGGATWIWHLPVTTQVALDLGVSVAGYPKFLADIEVASDGGIATCRLAESGRTILSLQVGHRRIRPAGVRSRGDLLTVKEGRLLRSVMVGNMPEAAASFGGRRVTLDIGDHPIADDLRQLEMGRVVASSVAPHNQSILLPPIESWPLATD
jgi:hypothetical protein